MATTYHHSAAFNDLAALLTVYYILSGEGEMHIDTEIQTIEPGDAVYIPPNSKQFVRNCGVEPLIFICIVDPAWRKEDEIVYVD